MTLQRTRSLALRGLHLAKRSIEVTYASIRLMAMIGFLAVIVGMAILVQQATPKLPEAINLNVVLPGRLSDIPSLRPFLGGVPSLRGMVEALREAADDPRVTTVVAEIGQGPFDLAQVQEMTSAVGVVRAAGKRTIAWTDTFGEILERISRLSAPMGTAIKVMGEEVHVIVVTG